jgi:hypothetical protein
MQQQNSTHLVGYACANGASQQQCGCHFRLGSSADGQKSPQTSLLLQEGHCVRAVRGGGFIGRVLVDTDLASIIGKGWRKAMWSMAMSRASRSSAFSSTIFAPLLENEYSQVELHPDPQRAVRT